MPVLTIDDACEPAPGADGPSSLHLGDDPRPTDTAFVRVPGGQYRIGSDDPDQVPGDSEGPPRLVEVRSFAAGATAVTNAEFATFVEATGYLTDAERFGWSLVFHRLVPARVAKGVRRRVADAPWWWRVNGACWRWPFGRGSHVRDRLDHPVVHISWNDAAAYCGWAGARLPSEAEWEVAGRGGLEGTRFPWGDALTPEGRHMCNIWQGDFPAHDTGADGFVGTCPVRSFPPNGLGLYEVAGNVWEWCDNWFSPGKTDAAAGDRKAIRGGSFLCHASYCNRYRVAARSGSTPDSSASNIGFRIVREVV